jgi:arylsulfatase A-like enzyme
MNVIVIAANGLHLGFLGPYGNAWIDTPHLDRLAAEGVVFDFHFPENLTTLPTRRSWWTGRYGFPDPDSGWTPLRPDERILPDFLHDQGIRSAIVSDVPYLRDPANGFARGFDDSIWIRGSGYDPFIPPTDPRVRNLRLEDEPGLRLPPDDDEEDDATLDEPDEPTASELWRDRWMQMLRNRVALDAHTYANTGAVRTVRAAIDWLDRRETAAATEPFLLWLDLLCPHGPWDLPPEYRDRYAAVRPDSFEIDDEGDLADEEAGPLDVDSVTPLIDVPPGLVGDVLDEAELVRLRRTYAGAVSLLDTAVGELVAALGRQGRLDDTLIVFTSDQGEPLGEHGYVRRFRPYLYSELVHTPLILRLPKAQHGGMRHQAIVQAVDVLPTVLSALRVPTPEGVHGHDLLPLIRGEQTKVRDYACLGMDAAEFAIRTHHWNLILPVEIDPDDPRHPELYRKPEDRWDQDDVASQNAEVADQLELALRRFVDAVTRDVPLVDLPGLRDAARFTEA